MSIDIKQCGRVYKHINDAIQNNYSRHTLPWAFDGTKNTILKSKELEKEADAAYPEEFHEAIGDVILRWCFDGYKDTGKNDLYKILLKLWQFHKKWLLYVDSDNKIDVKKMDEDAAKEISALCNEKDKDGYHEYRTNKITDLYVAVMEHVLGVAADKEAKPGEEIQKS